jgi:hypothetical protein
MKFKFVPKEHGIHVRVSVFIDNGGPALSGHLTFAQDEWDDLRAGLIRSLGGDARPDGSIEVESTADV